MCSYGGVVTPSGRRVTPGTTITYSDTCSLFVLGALGKGDLPWSLCEQRIVQQLNNVGGSKMITLGSQGQLYSRYDLHQIHHGKRNNMAKRGKKQCQPGWGQRVPRVPKQGTGVTSRGQDSLKVTGLLTMATHTCTAGHQGQQVPLLLPTGRLSLYL